MAANESRSPDVMPHDPFVTITLSHEDAQALYDHTGTMPWVPGSWSKNIRDELSEALHMLNAENAPSFDYSAEILDPCCGGRMWWWAKQHPLALYMDVREAPRGSVGEITGRPEWNPSWECRPDVVGDFRNMPFEDDSFQLVVFDPPHVVREKQPPEGINGLKYGALHPDTEQEDLRLGFFECWRVLRPGGTLVFKWAGKLDRVRPHFPAGPVVGTRSPRGLQTWWIIFYKPLEAAATELT